MDGLTNILYLDIVYDKYNVSYDYKVETFAIHTP